MRSIKIIALVVGILAIPSLWVLTRSYQEELPLLATSADIDDEVSETTGAAKVSDGGQDLISKYDFNKDVKRQEVIKLVDEAVSFMEKNTLDVAFNSFTHGKDFNRGELYIFVYDYTGICLANGQDARWVWKDVINLQDPFGTLIIQEMIKKSKEGGGWVTYQWRNATKISYVKPVTKDGRKYVLGAGYYPHSKTDLVVSLVKGATAFFNDVVIKRGLLTDEVFSTLSYPTGRFVAGDLYLYAVNFDGTMMANGDRPGLIGTNVLNVTDAAGKFVNQEIINKLKNSTEGVWVEYLSKNAKKMAYAEKVTDKKGISYFIACGYYPEETPQKAVDLVKDGYEFMKKQGLTAAANEFSDRRVDTYRYGDLYLVVYDLKGAVMAHGGNTDYIGMNQWNLTDEDGKLFVQEMIEKANKGGGWVDFKLKNAFESAYVEKVDLGTDSYVISSGIYPISKRETALLLARSAAGYLRTHSNHESFSEFTDPKGKFIRGDLYIFVIEFSGIVAVWGDNFDMIWRNILNATDDNGKPYVQILINTVKQGPGQVTFNVNGQQRIALVEMVDKEGLNYVIGTGYYL